MNILLTGSNGFLGSIIKQELSDNYNISTLSRSNALYNISLEKEIPDFKQEFDLIIHAAGKAHSIPKTEFEKKQFDDVNFLGTSNILKGLEKSGMPKQFIFISSVAVYGQEEGNNVNEEHPLLASDPYGLSKIKAENLVVDWCKKNKVTHTILRLPLLVGENPPGNLGAMIKAIKRGYYFNIGKGQARKSMVLCKDVALLLPIVAPIGGIYNLTDGFHPNFHELSLAISKGKKHFSLPVSLAKIIGKIGDIIGDKAPVNSLKVKKIISDLVFDDSKAKKLLNWNPEPVLVFFKNEEL
jgi:nucleoside-diphosphate-sugar epimerase